MLVPALYMLQIYDRVLSSRNETTLLMLTLCTMALLEEDHRRVKKLLEEADSTTERAPKLRTELLNELVTELRIHETIEEEIFYPSLEEHAKTKEIALEGYEEHHAVDSIVDERTRNIQVQATLANLEGRLRPGMFVQTEVVLGASSSVISLPASAISYAPYGDSVFVVTDLKGPNGQTYRGVRQQFARLSASQDTLTSLAADTGGLRELVVHEATGLRFVPGDPASLARTVLRLLTDARLDHRLTVDARRMLNDEFSWARIAGRTADVYERAIAEEDELRRTRRRDERLPLRVILGRSPILGLAEGARRA